MSSRGAGRAAETSWPRCPGCGAAARTTWVEFPELAFVRCSACGVVYKSREVAGVRPGDLYEAGYYSPRKRSRRDGRFEHRVRKASRQIEAARELGDVHDLLDVGCSVGFVIEAGRRLGLAAAGMDISEYAVEQCRARGLRAEVGTLEAMPWGDGEFDLVLMKHVLEHTPEPARALAEVRRVTRPGALVVVAVPDLRYWKGLWRRRSYRYFRPDDLGRQHYVYYTAATLGRVLRGAGFTVLASSKAVPRRRSARRSLLVALLEPVRFAVVWAATRLASALLLRREVVIIARREAAPPA